MSSADDTPALQLAERAEMELAPGTPDGIERAIEHLEAATALLGPDTDARLWATVWFRLGTAYRRRGAGEATTNLSRAVDCLRAVLSSWRREFGPEQWGAVQFLLALTHYERNATPADIEAAIAGFEAALTVRDRETSPLEWAQTHGRLADALLARPTGDRAGNLERAIASYELATEILAPASDPHHYALAHRGLGIAYGARLYGDRAENSEKEIEHLTLSLEAERHPLARVMTFKMLGSADLNRVHGDRSENFASAIEALERALATMPETLPSDVAYEIELLLGVSLRDRAYGDVADDLERAIAHHERAVELAGEDPQAGAEALIELGDDFRLRTQGDHADNLERAIGYLKAGVDRIGPDVAPLLWVRGQTTLASAVRLRVRGHPDENLEGAIGLLEAAATVATREQLPARWAQIRMNLGNAWAERQAGDRAHNLLRALNHYDAALDVFGSQTWPMDWARIRLNQGVTHRELAELGDEAEQFGQAAACLEDALSVFSPETAPRLWASARRALGHVLMLRAADVDSAELERSLECFEDVLRVSEESGMPLESASAHAALGMAYQKRLAGDGRENLDRAVAHLHAALEVQRRDTAPQQWAKMQGNLGRALARRGRAGSREDLQAAIEALEGALEVASERGMTAVARDAADLLAELHAERGAWPAAAEALHASVALAEDLYASSLLLSSRRVELEHAGERFARRAFAGMRAGEDARTAVELLERGRARALGEALGRDRADLESLAASHPATVERFRAAASHVRQLDVAETALGEPALPQAGSSYLQRREREELQAALRARVTQARESFATALQEVRHLAGDTSLLIAPGFDQIAATDPSVVLAYVRATRWGGIALLVRGGEVESIDLPGLTDRELLERVRTYAVAESRHGRDPAAFSSALDDVTRWSWEVAIADLIAALEPDARVVVIAGGLLGVLPLHAAWTADTTARCGRLYAIDRALMSYAPSARGMAEAWRVARGLSATSMLAVDDPQPVTAAPLLHAGHEAAAACAAFAAPARRLSGEQATATAVSKALPTATVLHLACHAQAHPGNPWDSGILMAHDELLRLRDMQALTLRARLAVLSACETGQTGYRLLDEAIGMPGALLQAGVGAVIASLWRVPDEATMLLMTDFYERWRADPLRPAAALRGAQRWLRDSTGGEKRLRFESLLDADGDGWLPCDVAQACYMAVALDEPDELAHAAPTEWAAFGYVGA